MSFPWRRERGRPSVAAYPLRELPVTLEIAALALEVAVPHADPCDRMIVATAQLHGIPVMISDHLITACRDIERRQREPDGGREVLARTVGVVEPVSKFDSAVWQRVQYATTFSPS
ncbi:MAG TPA: PIN domain-containing protein [Kofleriaceae bacterium]